MNSCFAPKSGMDEISLFQSHWHVLTTLKYTAPKGPVKLSIQCVHAAMLGNKF